MILHIEGDLNPYYAQTLCLIYFPGAKFGADEVKTPDTPCVDIYVEDRADGIYSRATIARGDKSNTADCFVPFSDLFPKERVRKMASGHAMTLAAKAFFGFISPWGLLTGVRPAKVAAQYLASGLGVMKTRKLLATEYFLNPKKAFLATAVAQNELRLTKAMPADACSVYISVPFCPTRCAYCSFISSSQKMLSLIGEYLNKLLEDIRMTFATAKAMGMRVCAVYIGGGTPTTLTAGQLRRLLSTVAKCVDISTLEEFTLEAGRPDTITAEKLKVAAAYGVTRICVNPQSLCQNVLDAIGRRHTVDQFFSAYDLAAKSQIRDINCDLIVGLPGDDFKTFSQTLDTVISLDPTNITVHTFCFKRAADLMKTQGTTFIPDVQATAKSVQYSQLSLPAADYKPYYMYRQKNAVGNLENVGYAKAGHACMYNIYMMEEMQSIFGCGAGAVTKLILPGAGTVAGTPRMKRIFAPKYPYEYFKDFETHMHGDAAEGRLSYAGTVARFFGKEI